MPLSLFNSLSRKKEIFSPLSKKKVLLYCCGITPNNATHFGHAFTYVSFDVLIRYLQFRGYRTDYLQNATDINDSDDVIKQAQEIHKTWQELAAYWIGQFKENLAELNVLPPDHYVLATSAVPTIIKISQSLLKKGFAYEKNGNVYFDVKQFPRYGKLSKFTAQQQLLLSKERGNNPDDPNKRNQLDFVLWIKASKAPHWESPWGLGRPGWHIECTAMIHEYLGEQIDIHGGGRDLIFPHHESEIAQSEAYTTKKPYVGYWFHIGMVLYEGEKMSKSLGNLILVSDLLQKFSPNAIRWLLLAHHYRQPWEYHEEDMVETEILVSRCKDLFGNLPKNRDSRGDTQVMAKFMKIMDDDLNTPGVMEYLCTLVMQKITLSEKVAIYQILKILGFKV